MSDISLVRHLSIIDPSQHRLPIHIIGVGATGSRLFASLVELGFTNITIYDFDIVEAHNLANQLYAANDINKTKVAACQDWYQYKTGAPVPNSIQCIPQKVPFEGMQPMAGIVFLLTDTMASRREIFETCLKGNPKIKLVIETRMASSYGNIFTFNPFISAEADAWVSTLIDDGAAEVSACGTSISVGPTASIIANMALWQMILFLTDKAALDKQVNIFLKPLIVASVTQ